MSLRKKGSCSDIKSQWGSFGLKLSCCSLKQMQLLREGQTSLKRLFLSSILIGKGNCRIHMRNMTVNTISLPGRLTWQCQVTVPQCQARGSPGRTEACHMWRGRDCCPHLVLLPSSGKEPQSLERGLVVSCCNWSSFALAFASLCVQGMLCPYHTWVCWRAKSLSINQWSEM